MADPNPSPVVVPLMLNQVIVGTIIIDDHDQFSAQITSPCTQSYLKEMMLVNHAQSVSMNIDYAEPSNTHGLPPKGHLRLVRE